MRSASASPTETIPQLPADSQSCRIRLLYYYYDYYDAHDKQRRAFHFGIPRDVECSLNLESHMLGFKPEIWNSSPMTFYPIYPSAYFMHYFLFLGTLLHFMKATKVHNDKIRGDLTAFTSQPSHLYSFVQSHKPTGKLLTRFGTP